MSFLWIRGTFPRVRIDQLMRFAWLCLIPMALLTLPAAGIWHFMGRGFTACLVTIPLLLIPWIILWGIVAIVVLIPSDGISDWNSGSLES